MSSIPRFRRYRRNERSAGPMTPDDEIRFILARYDDGAIPPAIFIGPEETWPDSTAESLFSLVSGKADSARR